MAARKTAGSKSAQLAVVLTGNAARAAAVLGALEALEQSGQTPSVLVGASGGAVAAALYAAGGSAAARTALYNLARANSWQHLADIDFDAVLNLATRPHEANGFLKGEALQAALLASSIGHKGFAQLDPSVLIVTTDLNSGRELVFGNQTQETEGLPYRVYARSAADLARVNVATACRASMATPGLFQPLSLEQYCLVDGGLRARQALTVAAAQPGVERIIWLHAGLDLNETFSLVTDYAGQSFAVAMAQAAGAAATDQFDPHTGDPLLAGKVVRYVNLAVSSVGTAELVKTQALYESGRRTMAALMAKGELFGDGPALATALAEDVDETDGPRWSAVVGAGGRDVVSIADLRPTLQQEFGYEFEEYLEREALERLEAREPQATVDWAQAQAEQELGLARLFAAFAARALAYGGKGLWGLLRCAWHAVALDKLVGALAKLAEDGAMAVADKLAHQDAPASGSSES